MKISKRQLRRIIREDANLQKMQKAAKVQADNLGRPTAADKKTPAGEAFYTLMQFHNDGDKQKFVDDYESFKENNLDLQGEYEEKFTPDLRDYISESKGSKKMKITKRQLKQIIKEEKARILEMNAGYAKVDRAAPPQEIKRMSKDEAHTTLVDTILQLEEILGEAGVRAALSEMGYQ